MYERWALRLEEVLVSVGVCMEGVVAVGNRQLQG